VAINYIKVIKAKTSKGKNSFVKQLMELLKIEKIIYLRICITSHVLMDNALSLLIIKGKAG
jgi:hypothetical protein